MPDLVTEEAIREAARVAAPVTVRTPLLSAPWLEEELDAEVRLKCESLQRTGSFKLRGAYTMIARLPPRVRQRGVVAYSAGNHAQAVALAARLFDTTAVVVMPTDAPQVKIKGVERWGAEVVLAGRSGYERQARAEQLAAERQLVLVPPFDHPDIIAGQGAIGLEILGEWPEVDAILVPVGGGGMLSGVAAWAKRMKPTCEVIGIGPDSSFPMNASYRAGRPVVLDEASTVADGLRIERVSELTLAHVNAFVDGLIAVPDNDLVAAAGQLLLNSKLVVEYAGAAGVAALQSGRWKPRGRRTAVVLSGGNIDTGQLRSLATSPDFPADRRPDSR